MDVKYRLTDPITEATVAIAIQTQTVDSVHPIIYQSDNALFVERIKTTVALSTGIYGHLIGEKTTILDLVTAMRSPALELYNPTLIAGQVPQEQPNLVSGTQT